jgi:hypothetical protein
VVPDVRQAVGRYNEEQKRQGDGALKLDTLLTIWNIRTNAGEYLRVCGLLIRVYPLLSDGFVKALARPEGNVTYRHIGVVGVALRALTRRPGQSRYASYRSAWKKTNELVAQGKTDRLRAADRSLIISWFLACYLVCALDDGPFTIRQWMWYFSEHWEVESGVQCRIDQVKSQTPSDYEPPGYPSIRGYLIERTDLQKARAFLEIRDVRQWHRQAAGLMGNATYGYPQSSAASGLLSGLSSDSRSVTAPDAASISPGSQISHYSPSMAPGSRVANSNVGSFAALLPAPGGPASASANDHPPLNTANYHHRKEERMASEKRICAYCGRSHDASHIATEPGTGRIIDMCAAYPSHPRFTPKYKFRLATEVMAGRQVPQPDSLRRH